MSVDQILKIGTRDKGIMYVDGPLPLMHTYNPLEEGGFVDSGKHRFTAVNRSGAGILYNGDRLLAVDFIHRVWGRIGGICYDGMGDSDSEFEKRVSLYAEMIALLKNNLDTNAIREQLKSLMPYTRGLYGDGVL